MNTTEKSIRVRDIEIACRTVGHGTPIVVLHGGPGIGHGYLRPLDAWADEFQVVYYDQRGSGGTSLGDVDQVTFTGGIADLDALRQSLGIDRVNLVGHSFGGLLAMIYAAQHPDTTASLVLLQAAPPFIPDLQNELWATMAARRTPDDNAEKAEIEASPGFAARDPKTVERFFVNMYLPFFADRANAAGIDMGFTVTTAANAPEGMGRMFRDHESLDPMGALARIECPTLVVHSEDDPVPQAFSRLLVDKIAGAEYAFLEGVNHFVHLEDPDLLAARVKPFLRKHAV